MAREQQSKAPAAAPAVQEAAGAAPGPQPDEGHLPPSPGAPGKVRGL